MRLNFPLKDEDKWLNATKHYKINETIPVNVNENSIGGWYPVGANNFWHAGVHFDCGHSIHAVADGEMVAYRVSEKMIKPSDLINQYEEPKGKIRKIIEHPISDNFVLTKHDYKPPEGDPFTFYVLYMHLLPLKELNNDQKKKLTLFHRNTFTTNVDLNIRDGALSTNAVIKVAPVGAELIFENPVEIADENSKLITPTDNQYYKKIKGFKHDKTYQAISGYVYTHHKYIEVKKVYNPLIKVVENCKVEVKRGDIIGWPGNDGTRKDKTTVHMELFVKDKQNLVALRAYTNNQREKNASLDNENLLKLYDSNILTEAEVEDSFKKQDWLCDVTSLIKKTDKEGKKFQKFSIKEAIQSESLAPMLRVMVTKHPSEWLPVGSEKETKFKNRLVGDYKWSDKKFAALKELHFERLAFWHLLRDSTDDDRDFWQRSANVGSSFPDEVYFFHPIAFIHHLRLIGYKIYGGYELKLNDKDSESKWEGATQSDEGSYVKELQKDLVKLGYWVSDPTDETHKGMKLSGEFDKFTKGAIETFQIEYFCLDSNKKVDTSKVPPTTGENLKLTGKVNKETAEKIKELIKTVSTNELALKRPAHKASKSWNKRSWISGTGWGLWTPASKEYGDFYQLIPHKSYLRNPGSSGTATSYGNTDAHIWKKYKSKCFEIIQNQSSPRIMADCWGKAKMIKFLLKIAKKWKDVRVNGQAVPPFKIGDIASFNGGPLDPHGSHQDGMSVDLNGSFCNPSGFSSTQDRDIALKFAQTLAGDNESNVKRIVINCHYIIKNVTKAQQGKNHHHHFHVDIPGASGYGPMLSQRYTTCLDCALFGNDEDEDNYCDKKIKWVKRGTNIQEYYKNGEAPTANHPEDGARYSSVYAAPSSTRTTGCVRISDVSETPPPDTP